MSVLAMLRRAQLNSQMFTSSGTFVVPADVYTLLVSMCGGGGPGAYASSGGSGGSGGFLVNYPLSVSPGETLVITVGAAGVGSGATPTTGKGGNTLIQRASTTLLITYGGNAGTLSGSTPVGGDGGWPNGSGGGGATRADSWNYGGVCGVVTASVSASAQGYQLTGSSSGAGAFAGTRPFSSAGTGGGATCLAGYGNGGGPGNLGGASGQGIVILYWG